jgi:beta-galactosidase
MISFALSGPGIIAGVDNGNAISHEPYKGTTRSAFSGKALAIIQSTATSGTVTLKATSGTLTSGSVVITTTRP